MLDVILDSLIDTAKLLPFLIIVYILIELLEHKTTISSNHNALTGPLAPLLGSATGLIPQCGFSVMAAKLFEKNFIKIGTLLAVFISTSDEAFIILLTSGDASAMLMLLPLLIIKFALSVAVGYSVNAIFAKHELSPIPEHKHEHSDEGADVHMNEGEKEHEHEHEHDEDMHYYTCGREHDGSNWRVYLINPLLHSLKVALFIFLVNLTFGTIIHYVGEDAISSVLVGGPFFQPFLATLVGLIPNCASSVIITESFVLGGITFGSCVAGLCANAGLGLVVLLKNTKKWKRNIFIILAIYFISSLSGVIINLIMMLF